jgi:Ribonuclease HepT-like
MRDDLAIVLDIVLAARRIARFVADCDEPTFLADEEKHWAVVSQLSIIGEAVRRLSDAFRACASHDSLAADRRYARSFGSRLRQDQLVAGMAHGDAGRTPVVGRTRDALAARALIAAQQEGDSWPFAW